MRYRSADDGGAVEHHKNTATQRRLQSARLRRESALDTSTRLSRVATAGESRPAPKPFEGGDGRREQASA